jgi:hypothetical protein
MRARGLRSWGVAAAALLAALAAAGPDAPGADEWKYDVVIRRDAPPLRGLLVSETETHLVFKSISRRPGSPTIVFNDLVPRRDVVRIDPLSAEDREVLRLRLEALAKERAQLQDELKRLGPKAQPDRFDAVPLEDTPWPPDPQKPARAYQSTHFRLVSNATVEVTQLAAIHLEQVYGAYARCLPPRAKNGQPTTILLTATLEDYQELVRGTGQNFLNPAFYEPARNRVVCGADLQRLYEGREKARRHNAAKKAELETRQKQLVDIYKGSVPPTLMQPILQGLRDVAAAEKINDQGFERSRQRLFRCLYHEAFHAYLAAFVYPEAEVPRWLNEGLAQVFETAIVEVGTLRVGHADPERLEAVRTAITRGTLLPLADLLRSGPKDFQVAHAGDRQVSDRHYLAAWALAMHLTFERRVLGTKAMDDYIEALKRGADPLVAFSGLVGQPLAEFEKDHLRYLRLLRPDGTVAAK